VTQLEAAYLHTDCSAPAASAPPASPQPILILTVLPEREERFDLPRAVDMLAPQHFLP
jgi:hypothetical protein